MGQLVINQGHLLPLIAQMGTDEYLHKELSEDIVGAAMTVLNKLKPGLREKTYENALVLELLKRGHDIEQQAAFDVTYDGVVIDTLIPDLIVDRKVIVDPKCVTEFSETHYAQMIGYLAITGIRLQGAQSTPRCVASVLTVAGALPSLDVCAGL